MLLQRANFLEERGVLYIHTKDVPADEIADYEKAGWTKVQYKIYYKDVHVGWGEILIRLSDIPTLFKHWNRCGWEYYPYFNERK